MTHSDTITSDWRELKIEGFLGLIGPLLRSTRPGHQSLYALRTHEAHRNAVGLIHGGVLTSLLDQVFAMEAWRAAERKPTVTVQMDTRFLGPAKVGDLLESRATVRQASRSLIFLDADITCGAKSIANANAIMKILNPAGHSND